MKRPVCSFCQNLLTAQTPTLAKCMQFRCQKCNVNIIITNPSYINTKLREVYWHLVNNQLLGKQEEFWEQYK